MSSSPNPQWNLRQLAPEIHRLLLVEVGKDCAPAKKEDDPSQPDGWKGNKLCYYKSLLVNTAGDYTHQNRWVEALTATSDGLKINPALFADRSPAFTLVINGDPVTPDLGNLVFGSEDISSYHVEAYENARGCRRYALHYEKGYLPEAIDVEIPILKLIERVDTGIRVGAPKVYDSFLLRSRLNAAATQLAAISPWSAGAITGAYGTIQGVSRDTSYLAAQIQTNPTPSQVFTNNTGSTTSPVVTTTQSTQCPAGTYASGISTTGVTCATISQPSQQCPSGYYASSLNPLTCTLLPTAVGSQFPVAVTNPQLPGVSLTTTQNSSTPQSTQLQTSTPSYTPAIPTAPTSNPFSAPTNLSVSSSDMLAEQVQLNAQLQMYQMLLQGSQSDQFLVRNSMAVATRAQTTIGFQVSLAPPRQYKHALAEVRVVIVPHPHTDQSLSSNEDRISVVNLLPSQKTYNVAKITSHQDAFGAGAVIEPVNVGFAAGRSKDRLYLAKDTDTVALEYPVLTTPDLKPPFPEQALQVLEELVKEQRLGECDTTMSHRDRSALDRSSVMFGWQFRPVLGADYVTAGPREVFAQLALPNELDQDGFAPAVYVQTRWREYDEKRQVVGPVYHDTCVWTRAQDSVSILSPLRVHDVSWEDVGNGILKVRAEGKFFASGMTVMSAGTNITPTAFDGTTIQFFAPAHDLLQNGDLKLLGESGRTTPLAIAVDEGKKCGIETAALTAVPYPDGNSRVELRLKYQPGYESEENNDGPIHPLVLIGNDVYGIGSKPFQEDVSKSCLPGTNVTCTYHFLAATDSLKSAQTALVRDIAWEKFDATVPIGIGLSFSSLARLTPAPASDETSGAANPAPAKPAPAKPVPAKPAAPKTANPPAHAAPVQPVPVAATPASAACNGTNPPATCPDKPVWFTVTGAGFRRFFDCDRPCEAFPNLKIYLDDDHPDGQSLTREDFHPLSDTTALLRFQHAPKAKSVKIIWDPKADDYVTQSLPAAWDLEVPKDDSSAAKTTASPAFLHAGDTQIVKFTGKFTNALGVYFESAPLLLPTAPKKVLDAKELDVPVSDKDVTRVAGHKQLEVKTTDDKGQPKSIYLDIDVFRR